MAAVTIDQVKQFLRYEADDTEQDDTVSMLLAAAVDWVERHTGHLLTEREVTERVAHLRGSLALTYWPVEPNSVTVDYFDSAGAALTVDGVRLSVAGRPASVSPALNASWPIADYGAGVSVSYTAGYADPDDVPPGLVHAVCLYAAMNDEQRGGQGQEWSALYNLVGAYRLPGLG